MRPNFDKVDNTNKLLLKTLLSIVVISAVIPTFSGASRELSPSTTEVVTPQIVAMDTAEITRLCSLDEVICSSEKAVALPQAGNRTETSLSNDHIADTGKMVGDKIVVPENLMKIFKEVCYEHNFKDSDCPKVLAGMAYTESRFDPNAKGDYTSATGYRSFGLFQVQTRLHGITVAQARDPRFAADWTLRRLIAKGYPTYSSYSITRHNGAGRMAENYAKRVKLAINHITYE